MQRIHLNSRSISAHSASTVFIDSVQYAVELTPSRQSLYCTDDELNGIESIIIQLCMIVFTSFKIWFKVFLLAPEQTSSKAQRNIQLKMINFCQRKMTKEEKNDFARGDDIFTVKKYSIPTI